MGHGWVPSLQNMEHGGVDRVSEKMGMCSAWAVVLRRNGQCSAVGTGDR